MVGPLTLPAHVADLEWKLIYVGSAYDQQKDQVCATASSRRWPVVADKLPCFGACAQELESILVGPIPLGLNKIVFQVCAFYAASTRACLPARRSEPWLPCACARPTRPTRS